MIFLLKYTSKRFFVQVLSTAVLISTFSVCNAEETTAYTVRSGIELGTVDLSKPFERLARQGNHQRIRFLEPTIRGWVSSEFLSVDRSSNIATVLVNSLNFRIKPSLSGNILTRVYQGYKSPVLKESNGFSLIFAPAIFEVMVAAENVSSVANQRGWSGLNTVVRENDVLSSDPEETTGPSNSVVEDIATDYEGSPTVQHKSDNLVTESNNVYQIQVSEGELNHRLAAGDSISLMVFGEADLSVENVRVPQSGQVSFPLIGSVEVLGKTTTQVEQEVAEILSKGYVKNPRLSISIFSYRPIFIRGEVASEGSFPYGEGLTIAKAIALAGGLSTTANENGISILRDGELVAQDLSIDSQYRVVSGDIVTVSADLLEKEAEAAYIFLHGEVANAGAYEYQQGLTVEKAVVLAGGFSLRAAKSKISVSRYSEADDSGAPKLMKKVKLHEPIMPGDVIKVGASWF